MDLRDYVAESMTRIREGTLNTLKNLDDADLYWTPSPQANPIGFLVWHTARSEDNYFARFIAPGPQLWQRDGWHQKFGMSPDETGNSWNAEQVHAFRAPSKQALFDYTLAVRTHALAELKALDVAKLSERPRTDRPNLTRAHILQNVVSHDAHHQGAIDYLVGLRKAQFMPA